MNPVIHFSSCDSKCLETVYEANGSRKSDVTVYARVICATGLFQDHGEQGTPLYQAMIVVEATQRDKNLLSNSLKYKYSREKLKENCR